MRLITLIVLEVCKTVCFAGMWMADSALEQMGEQ